MAVAPFGAHADCYLNKVDMRWDGGQVQFTVELALNDEDRARGLMFREEMGAFEGMLFLYERPRMVSFWMKNTLIPLDMIFLNERGIVERVHPNAVPGDLNSIFGGAHIQSVLEINGGMAERLGLKQGAELRHPLLNQDIAAWPCEN